MAKIIDSIQVKRATSKTPAINNTILQDGEPLYIAAGNELYIGDGTHPVSNLTAVVPSILPISKGGTGKSIWPPTTGNRLLMLNGEGTEMLTTSPTDKIVNNSYIPIASAVYNYVNKSTSFGNIAPGDTHLVTGGAVAVALKTNTTSTINTSEMWATSSAIKSYVDTAIANITGTVDTVGTIPTTGDNNKVPTVNAVRKMATNTVNTADTFYFTTGSAIKSYVDSRFGGYTGNLKSAAQASTTATVSNNTYLPTGAAITAYINTRLGTSGNLGTAAQQNVITVLTTAGGTDLPNGSAVVTYIKNNSRVDTKTNSNISAGGYATGNFTVSGTDWKHHVLTCSPNDSTSRAIGIVNMNRIQKSGGYTTIDYILKNVGSDRDNFTVYLHSMK